MKALFYLFSIIFLVAILIVGNMYWHQRTDVSVFAKSADSEEQSDNVSKTETQTETNKKQTEDNTALLALTKNWPKTAADRFKETLENNQVFHVAIVGSDALGDSKGWAQQLADLLEKTYGKDHLNAEVFSFNTSASGFLKKDKTVLDYKPDFVLFEAFTVHDLEKWSSKKTENAIHTFQQAVVASNRGATFVLQPSNPIYQGIRHSNHTQTIKSYAEKNDITYVDHWDKWPSYHSRNLLTYVSDSSNIPTTAGDTLWLHALEPYFIAK